MMTDTSTAVVRVLTKQIPKLKTKLQLTAFITSAAVIFLLRVVAPDNVPAQICSGLIGISLIVFAQLFQFLDSFPARERGRVVLRLFGLFCIVTITLLALTIGFLMSGNSRTLQTIENEIRDDLSNRISDRASQLKKIDILLADNNVQFQERSELEAERREIIIELPLLQEKMDNLSDTAKRQQEIVGELRRILGGSAMGSPDNARRAAEEAFARGDHNRAEKLFLEIIEHSTDATADATFWLGRLAESRGTLAEATRRYQNALSLRPDEPRYLEASAKLNWQRGAYQNAATEYTKLVEILEQTKGVDSPDVAMALRDSATVARFQDDFPQAEMKFRHAVEILDAGKAKHKSISLQVFDDLGGLYLASGNFKFAGEIFGRGLEILDTTDNDALVGVGEFWNDYGFFCYTIARFATAEESYLKALRWERASLGGNHPFLAVTHANLGNLFRQQGRYLDAQRELDTAIEQGKKIWGDSHPRFGRFLISVARLNLSVGHLAIAISTIEKAINVLEENVGIDHSWLVPALITRAEAEIERGDISGAKASLERALQIVLKVFREDHPLTAEIRRNQARVLCGEHKDLESEEAFTLALGIFQKTFGDNHPEFAQTLIFRADYYRSRGELDKAREDYERSASILQKFFADDHPLRIKTAAALSAIQLSSKVPEIRS
jgi:tetratricopeptide (TPR) repeat protein